MSGEKLQFLASALPEVSIEQLRFVLGIHCDDVEMASTFFLEGVSLSSLLGAIKTFVIDDEEEVCRIKVADLSDPERLKEDALSFYQGNNCNWRAELRVDVANRPVIDEGGVRRQFFNSVIESLKSSMFEGPPVRVRPIFKLSSISSGALYALGKIVGHSITLDGQGFPYLSPPCYLCMVGRMDGALSALWVDDAGDRIREAVLKVRFCMRFVKKNLKKINEEKNKKKPLHF